MSEIEIPSLTIKDKMNYSYILGNALLKFQQAIVKVEGEQSEQEVREAALCIYNLIPKIWQDEDFKKDLKEATFMVKVDVRKEWCGRKVGQPKFEEQEKLEPWKLINACVNLLERKELLGKKQKVEKMSGVFNVSAFGPESEQEPDFDS